MSNPQHKSLLDLAARLAFRAAGDVEPNPMVGAVIVRDGRIIGMGHHKKFGGLHAEREALADCHRRGEDPRGAVVYVTLEPCCHHGKQPPCTEALIQAGIGCVVAARADPNPISCGGAEILRRAGIACEFSDASRNAIEISAPFVKRITTGLPWVIAKWAQTLDGGMITRPGEPRWISGEVSRQRVHRLRARVDAVMTGMGTVLTDDPRLTARGVARVRRVARRVVLDSRLALPPIAQLARTAREAPTLILTTEGALTDPGAGTRRSTLESMGVEVAAVPTAGGQVDLATAAGLLASRGITTVLLEAGPRLLASMFAADLVDLAIVHIGRGAASGAIPLAGPIASELGPDRFRAARTHRIGPDLERIFVRTRS